MFPVIVLIATFCTVDDTHCVERYAMGSSTDTLMSCIVNSQATAAILKKENFGDDENWVTKKVTCEIKDQSQRDT